MDLEARRSGSSTTPPILIDTVFLLFLRLVYFFLSRRFLLSSLSPTLRDLSKPEILLPPPDASRPRSDSQLSLSGSGPSSSSNGIIPMSDLELDAELEDNYTEDGDGQSYPPSPIRSPAPLPLPPFVRRGTDDQINISRGEGSSRAANAGGAGNGNGTGNGDDVGIEMMGLGQKIKDATAAAKGKVQVLQLSHGRREGTKGIKKATRGLSRLSRALFSACFAESCNILSLVMFHSLGILHSRSRHVNFSVSLHVLLALVLLIVPMVQCLLLTYRSRESSSASTTPSRTSSLPLTSRILIALIPFSLYCFLFTRIPPYIAAVPLRTLIPQPTPTDDGYDPEPSPSSIDEAIAKWTESGPEGWEGEGWLAPSLGRLVALGVVVLATLSGFGAARTAWGFFEHASAGTRPLTDNDLLQAERSLYRVRQELVTKRDELSRTGGGQPGSPSRGWMGKVFANKDDQQAAALRAELEGLEAMERQVARSMSAMKLRRRRQDFGQTLRGKIYNIIGYIFAFYCAARLLMCLPSIFFSPLSTSNIPSDETSLPSSETDNPKEKGNTNGDWISFVLALGLAHLPTGAVDIDVAVWSRAISLLLTGLLVLSSLTQVLRSLGKVLRLTSKTVGAGFLLLSLGQLFATYTISLLVQLRTSIPPAPEMDTDPFASLYGNGTDPNASNPFSSSSGSGSLLSDNAHRTDDSLLATLPDFRVFGRLFDVVFLLAALGTGLYRYIAMKINGADEGGEVYRR
ncbi:Abscisic acid G-protein coupled receptor-domain-containing protein [Naematelia encephala]|uniref:Abscisic acid G-protein coupled receptor-domain-containing protein n=1 Tax=Naematelia encephala TaxID=71784 RepID=A0A1Y2BDG7_9TREE|nr:Abscisic acid G-protein coupled receptor-domain-containing protein [Naematelia encephala]